MIKKSRLLFALLIGLSGTFSGCFAWNYVKEGYDNFSAYFNTYYNASRSYDDGMKDLESSEAAYQLSLISGAQPPPFALSQRAKNDFDMAIAKASKVLQLHPNSSFTEDCLFIIGISYQGDNVRGERKFLEIEATFPNTKRFAEAEMYYGAFELNGREGEVGRNRVRRAIQLARESGNRKVVSQSSGILADYYLGQEDTAAAAAYLDTASVFSDGDDAAFFACRAGMLFSDIGNLDRAESLFKMAGRDAKDIRIRFYSLYYLARVQRLQKQYYVALGRLNELRGDDKFFDFFPLIDYQEAAVMYDSGEVSKAVTAFQKIDTSFTNSEASTRSAFRLAQTYLYLVGDFQSALKYYQRVGSHPKVYGMSEQAQKMSTTLQDYMITGYKVILSDSLYRKAELAAERNDSVKALTQSNLDTLYEHAADARESLAGLFMFKLQMPDSAIKSYKDIIRDFPKSKAYTSALYTLGEYYYSTGDTADGKMYLEQLLTDYPRSEYAASAASLLGVPAPRDVDLSQIEYQNALSLVNQENYDAAMDTLNQLLLNRKSPLVPQALYLKGWIYETRLQKPDSAYLYYKALKTEYPSSEFSPGVTLAISGYEAALRDSAEARQKRLDSTRTVPVLKGESGAPVLRGEGEKPGLPKPATTPADSLKLKKKEMKEIERQVR